MKGLLAAVLVLVGLLGCAGTEKRPASKLLDLHKDTLFVLSVPAQGVEIGPMYHFRDAFGFGEDSLARVFLAGWFDSVFAARLKDRVKPPRISRCTAGRKPATGFVVATTTLEQKETRDLHFWLPTREEWASQGKAVRYLLVIDSLEVHDPISNPDLSWDKFPRALLPWNEFPGGTTGPAKPISVSFHFMIWDYTRNLALADGIIRTQGGVGFFDKKSIWGDLIESGAHELVGETPLRSFLHYTPPKVSTPNL